MKKEFERFSKEKQNIETQAIIGYIIIGISFLLFIPISISTNGAGAPFIMLFFIGGGIFSGITNKKFKNLSNEFKSKFLPDEIKKIYPDCKFDVHSGFNKEIVYGSNVLQKQDRYHSEDMMIGNYQDVRFKSADVVLKDVRSNGKSTTVVTVFKGRVYEFDFNKKFKSNLLVLQPGQYRLFGKWNRVKTESIEFNYDLKIYAEDDHEAFYILTPHFMEKLLFLDRKYADKISFSFINNKLFIAINTGIDTFDMKMFNPLDISIVEEYKKQLNDIKDFIHELNLNKDLFKLT